MTAPARRSRGEPPDVFSLRVRDLWRFFAAQNLAYWSMCFYLVVEYVRPQQLLQVIYGAPLGQLGLGMALLGFLMSGAAGFGIKGPASWLLLLFTLVIFASSAAAYSPSASFDSIRVWVSWVVIFFLITSVVNNERRFAFFILLWLMCHVYMAQGGTRQFVMRGFRFATWGVIGAPGWFANSGEFGIAMCMYAVVSWHFYLGAKPHLTKGRQFLVLLMPATGVLCVLASSSRGAVLGLGVILAYTVARSMTNIRVLGGVALVCAAMWFILPAEQKDRFRSAGDDKTSMMRKVYWLNGLQMARSNPVLGVGYENWIPYYAAYSRDSEISVAYGIFTIQVAHNIFIQCMAELGYTGLAVFVLLIGATLLSNYQTRKWARAGPGPPNNFLVQMSYGLDGAMLSYIVAGFFVTVLYYPFFWINLAFTVALADIARRRFRQAQLNARAVRRQRAVPAARQLARGR